MYVKWRSCKNQLISRELRTSRQKSNCGCSAVCARGGESTLPGTGARGCPVSAAWSFRAGAGNKHEEGPREGQCVQRGPLLSPHLPIPPAHSLALLPV